MKNFFGAKVKLVSGYPGSREVSLAVLKNELHGVCGINWSSALLQYPDLLKEGGPFKVILQEDLKGSAELNKAGVPLVTKFSMSSRTSTPMPSGRAPPAPAETSRCDHARA